MCLRNVVALHERRRRQLPVHRKPTRLPPLGSQRLHLPFVVNRSERLEAIAQRGGAVIEVDPCAPAPQLTPHGDEAKIIRAEVVLGEDIWARHERVTSVEAPTPSMERADEAAPGSVAFHQLYTAMAAC